MSIVGLNGLFSFMLCYVFPVQCAFGTAVIYAYQFTGEKKESGNCDDLGSSNKYHLQLGEAPFTNTCYAGLSSYRESDANSIWAAEYICNSI